MNCSPELAAFPKKLPPQVLVCDFDALLTIKYSLLLLNVISSFSNLNRLSGSLGLFYHVPLKRDQLKKKETKEIEIGDSN